MIFAELSLALEPAWPWSIQKVGLPAMSALAFLLTLLTVWTYLGVRKATWTHLAIVLGLRLFALVLAFCMMLRPSFGVTHLEGVETSKLLVVFDASASMNEADANGASTRWEQVNRLWSSRNVQRRLEALAAEPKIEVVKYVAAEELRPDEPSAVANGKRTDIGGWLHQLYQKHGHEKHLRGIAIFSDGGDNGTRYPALEQARRWRGVCPIQTFGVGNPQDAKFGKDVALTRLWVEPVKSPIAAKSTPRLRGETLPIPAGAKMMIVAILQAPGYEKSEAEVSVQMENVETKEKHPLPSIAKVTINQAKDQRIEVIADAPKKEKAGEYKVTVKITPFADETNKQNNEISTFVQVVKDSINVLWVDRPRVYEPTFALRALRGEKQFHVHYVEPPTKAGADPIETYGLDIKSYDVIIIGDVAAQTFCNGKPAIFSKMRELVETNGMGLLLLGGPQAFADGGWDQVQPLLDLLPVTLDKTKKYSPSSVQVVPTKEAMQYPFLQLHPDPKENEKLWKEFEPLAGLSPLGELKQKQVALLTGEQGELVMAASRVGPQFGRVAVFAGDSTSLAWTTSAQNVAGYLRFWKQLVLWLSKQQDSSKPLWVDLDKRRLHAGEGDVLGFRFGLRGKGGTDLSASAKFTVHVLDPKQQKIPVSSFVREDSSLRGVYQGAKEPGEYQLIIQGSAKDRDGNSIQGQAAAHFLVDVEDVEMLRPVADHDLLQKIAVAADGRFSLAEEQPLLQYLDELIKQINSEARVKTTRWPDWKRLPASDHVRDQLAGVWNSFALISLVLFVALLGSEWFLRRWWGLV